MVVASCSRLRSSVMGCRPPGYIISARVARSRERRTGLMSEAPKSLPGYPLRLLAILALINFVNFADRQVITPLFPLLRDHFSATDAQLGSLQFLLQIVLAVASVPLGLLADRVSRSKIIAAGVIFWSLATFLSGMAGTFMTLLVARALVGLGEAAYGPAAQSMISGAFPASMPARAPAI